MSSFISGDDLKKLLRERLNQTIHDTYINRESGEILPLDVMDDPGFKDESEVRNQVKGQSDFRFENSPCPHRFQATFDLSKARLKPSLVGRPFPF
jgi:hypothetical protein